VITFSIDHGSFFIHTNFAEIFEANLLVFYLLLELTDTKIDLIFDLSGIETEGPLIAGSRRWAFLIGAKIDLRIVITIFVITPPTSATYFVLKLIVAVFAFNLDFLIDFVPWECQ
jgi:hypothetical protein